MKRSWGVWLVVAAFAVLLALLGRGLMLNPRELPSALVGKPAPIAQLQALPQLPNVQTAQRADLRTGAAPTATQLLGQVWMLNVWASWCVSCREEHGVLMDIARSAVVPLYGLAYKDKTDDALVWLRQRGNPYAASFDDATGRMGIELGVYGVPETFVIDRQGIVRHRSTGPLTQREWAEVIRPLVERLKRTQA